MRRTILLLVTFGLCFTLVSGCAKRRNPPVETVRPVVVVDNGVAAEKPAPPRGMAWQIKGWGRNQNEAEADAVQRATNLLTDFLHELKPPLTVMPAPAYVRQHLIHDSSQRRQELDQDIDKGHEVIKMQCWSLTLAVTPEDYVELARIDRQTHIEKERSGRMLVMARVLAGMVVLLLAVIGYIRLKEWAGCTGRVRSHRDNLRAAKIKVLAIACILIAVVVGFLYLRS